MTMTDCAVCDHADQHRWWGQSVTHCRKCHRSWTGLREIHCAGCCEHFSTPDNLDLHKTPNGGCTNPGQVVAKSGQLKLRTKTGPNGLTWVSADSRQDALSVVSSVAENR